jgi:hypothetical protein
MQPVRLSVGETRGKRKETHRHHPPHPNCHHQLHVVDPVGSFRLLQTLRTCVIVGPAIQTGCIILRVGNLAD